MGYDAKGRRITKAIANTGSWDCTYNYYHKGDSVIEEQNGSAQTIKQYVWGLGYIDELIQTSLNSNPTSQSTCDTPYWAEQDANWNVLGIVNSSGVLTERYEYGAYGQRTMYSGAGSNDPFCTAATTASTRFTANGTAEPWALCEVGHQGLIHDEESDLVYSRKRMFNAMFGRMSQREPFGYRYVDGINLYAYERNAPSDRVDPSGLDTKCTYTGNWRLDDTVTRVNVQNMSSSETYTCRCERKCHSCKLYWIGFRGFGQALGSWGPVDWTDWEKMWDHSEYLTYTDYLIFITNGKVDEIIHGPGGLLSFLDGDEPPGFLQENMWQSNKLAKVAQYKTDCQAACAQKKDTDDRFGTWMYPDEGSSNYK
jgi:RHS repeat-associated protein